MIENKSELVNLTNQKKIKLDNLIPNSYNARKQVRKGSFNDLKESIKQHGLIEPLVVRPLEEDENFEVVCGMRRFTALKDLEVEEVECIVKDLNDDQALDLAFIENKQRENLNPIEEANAFYNRIKSLILKEYGKNANLIQNQKEIEEKIGNILLLSHNHRYIKKLEKLYDIGAKTIANKLHLLNLPEELQNDIISENLPVSTAYEISRLNQFEDETTKAKEISKIYSDYKKNKLNLEEVKKQVSQTIKNQKLKQVNDKQQKHKRELMNHTKKRENKNNSKQENDDKVEDKQDKTKDIIPEIQILKNRLSNLKEIKRKVKEKNMQACNHCFSKIDLDLISQKEENFKQKIKELTNKKNKKLKRE